MDAGTRFFPGRAIWLMLGCTISLAADGSGITNYVTSTNDSGPGSFRQAILDNNASGGGRIMFSNVASPIVLTSSLPAFAAQTDLIGPGTHFPTFVGPTSLYRTAQELS